ncbi:aldehyde oxidoreductase [Candidatus Moduliflexus flocculans]|uniref:Aldehyde oxidoreductase n=1 Tax=Candidatus Moduliflexus flocculans TaxID=1499966 RepID=A0A081BTG0_9BACT|nr:aldehyde oxidoreductase [Candidatus Moduliflexus flocculans]
MNITRLSISAMLSFDADGRVTECILVDGAMFSRSQRLTGVEAALQGQPLTDAAIAAIREPLSVMIDEEIGTRWSAEYKKPVFINLCQDALRDTKQQFER